ncbi:MAG: soluble lytic murein transglycosylase [Clostridiales bacterium]|jgi:soluble lytic murein transglycosylase|nr:lytic transglycosylase domain-containing protein [Pygmaiobacter sp.]MDK2813310.1 soluble lytic murein transglycosylase [Clostridiales bacterium]
MKKPQKNMFILAGLLLVILVGLLVLPRLITAIEKRVYPQTYRETVEQYAAEYEVDPLMVFAIIRTESGFDAGAQSNVGARGLMQITEETFAWIKQKIAPEEEISFDDLYQPQVNIRFGTYYLSRCLSRYGGDLATASAAYHSGWGTVDNLLSDPGNAASEDTLAQFPYPQMARYVQKVDAAYQKYQTLYAQEKE